MAQNLFSHLGIKPSIKEECMDTNNEKTGSDNHGCDKYEVVDCGKQDDNDFNSTEMCCTCGGGRKGKRQNDLINSLY